MELNSQEPKWEDYFRVLSDRLIRGEISLQQYLESEEAFLSSLPEKTEFCISLAKWMAAFKIRYEGRTGTQQCAEASRKAGELAHEITERLLEDVIINA